MVRKILDDGSLLISVGLTLISISRYDVGTFHSKVGYITPNGKFNVGDIINFEGGKSKIDYFTFGFGSQEGRVFPAVRDEKGFRRLAFAGKYSLL